MKLAEEKKIVLAASGLNYTTGATQLTDSINMEGFHHCTFLIDIGIMGGGNSTLRVYSGASDAAITTELAFKYAYGGASALFAAQAANHDVLDAETEVVAATGLVIIQATKLNFLLVVEVDASTMAEGHAWLTAEFTDGGAATGLASVFAILEPRYTGNLSLSAVA